MDSWRVVLIDNYDSFTYNLVQAFGTLGAEVRVFYNDHIDLESIAAQHPTHLCISPGPGRPKDAGISKDVILHYGPTIPLVGVCLGHQCMVEALGGTITHADHILHGKASGIYHNNHFPFRDLPSPFQATRYHSLIADPYTLPECLEATAWTQDHELMAVRHTSWPMIGLQFHPESILTTAGKTILLNFLHNSF